MRSARFLLRTSQKCPPPGVLGQLQRHMHMRYRAQQKWLSQALSPPVISGVRLVRAPLPWQNPPFPCRKMKKTRIQEDTTITDTGATNRAGYQPQKRGTQQQGGLSRNTVRDGGQFPPTHQAGQRETKRKRKEGDNAYMLRRMGDSSHRPTRSGSGRKRRKQNEGGDKTNMLGRTPSLSNLLRGNPTRTH